MSIFKVDPADVEVVTLSTNPRVYFASSSSGITGSLKLFPRRSSIVKQQQNFTTSSFFDDTTFPLSNYDDPANVGSYLKEISAGKFTSSDPELVIKRLTPQYSGSLSYVNYLKKIISGTLMKEYRSNYSNCEMSYSNYNSLNFVSSSTIASGTALLYPNVGVNQPNQIGRYEIPGAFTFDFHINVRNKYANPRPGTILHLKKSYALSVVSGTIRDENGLCSKYGLQLQLSHSAGTIPTIAYPGSYPNDLTFRFDNVLNHNSWHHVTIVWGTNSINHGTGSVLIDGNSVGNFIVPSSSILNSAQLPPALAVGNYDDAMNTQTFSNFAQAYFGPEHSNAFGYTSITSPDVFGTSFLGRNNIGYFELHNLSIYRDYISNLNLSSSTPTQSQLLKNNCIFYLPPYFTTFSSLKLPDAFNEGGVLLSPKVTISGSTSTPFNLSLAMSCGTHYINTENYLLDFANNSYPKQVDLVYPSNASANSSYSLNDYFYQDYPVRGRNLLILPSDDGTFLNNPSNISVDKNISLINYVSGTYQNDLVNAVPPATTTSADPDKSVFIPVAGFSIDDSTTWDAQEQSEFKNILNNLDITPNTPFGSLHGAINSWKTNNDTKISNNTYLSQDDRLQPTAWYWKYLDKDSTQVVVFDISNLYYGDHIEPGTFVLSDSSLTGSGGQVSVAIKDDGQGGLYRADCLTQQASWNNIGNIFYNEGLVFIKNPSLYFLGKDQYEMSFRGNRNVHVMKFETTAPQNLVNSSSNPSYLDLRPTADQIDDNDNFVYITGINFHDDNLNVVARSKLAQPIIKRDRTRIVFKTKIDF